jgi:hypothetical protein
MPSPTYTRIASTTLVSETPTFDFTGITGTYYDLRLRFSLRTNVAGQQSTDINLTFNGATTNNYASVMLYNNNTTTSFGVSNGVSGSGFAAANSVWGGGVAPAAGSAVGSTFSNGQILIPGYVNTTNRPKARHALTDWGTSTTGSGIMFYGLVGTRSAVTSAITRVTLTCASGSFVVGSTVSLYGCNNTIT